MEITSTRVAPEGQMIAVEFLGGGELVSVVMSNVENNIGAKNAIQHARALLAQVLSFGSEPDEAINSYDALSNGNLDDSRHHATADSNENASNDSTHRGQVADDKLASGLIDGGGRTVTRTISTATPD